MAQMDRAWRKSPDRAGRQVHHESKNLVVRPAVNFANVGQEQYGEQFLENGLGKHKLKCSVKVGIHNAGRRGTRANGRMPGGMILQTTFPPRVTSTPFASIARERMNLLTAGDAVSTLMRVMGSSPQKRLLTKTRCVRREFRRRVRRSRASKRGVALRATWHSRQHVIFSGRTGTFSAPSYDV